MKTKKSTPPYLCLINRQLAIFAIMLLFNFAAFSQAGQKWSTSGNEVSSSEFIGTTNKVPLIFKTDNTEKLRISHNGNVGIGITVPLSKLHINGDIRSTSFAGLGNGLVLFNNDGVFTKLQFNNDANTVLLGNGTFGKYQDDDWKILGNNMYSLMSGNVGIGIENPEFKLDVNGDAKIRGELLIGNSIRLNGITDQISTTTGTLDFGSTNIITTGSLQADNIEVSGNTTFDKIIVNDRVEIGNGLRFNNNNAKISSANNLFIEPDNGNTILNLQNGFVGIGTDSPMEKLDVRGNANIRGTLYVYEGIITGRRVNSEMIKSDTVKTDNLEVVEELITKSIEAREDMISQKMYATEKVVTELTESRLIQSEEITTRDMKFGSNLVILGNESKIYSTNNHINFVNTSLTTTGNILSGQMQTGTLFADNIEITSTPKFTNLELANSLKVGENSVWITSVNQAGSSDNNIYSDNGNLKIQCQNNGYNTIINSGNGKVGIGTTTPGQGYETYGYLKLDVNGHGRFGTDADHFTRLGYNSANPILDGYGDPDDALHINYYSGLNTVIGGDGVHGFGDLRVNNNTNLAYKSGIVTVGSENNLANLEIKGGLKVDGLKATGTNLQMLTVDQNGNFNRQDIPSLCSEIKCIDGKVGIGLQSNEIPQATMHIKPDGDFQIGPWEMWQEGGGNVVSYFHIDRWTSGPLRVPMLTIDWEGKVGIGTNNPNYKLDVCGTIRSKEWIVETGWCDFKFDSKYKRMTWEEKLEFINIHKHLPEIESGYQIETNGLKVANTMRGFIWNIEDNALDIIELFKENQQQKESIEMLINENNILKMKFQELEEKIKNIERM